VALLEHVVHEGGDGVVGVDGVDVLAGRHHVRDGDALEGGVHDGALGFPGGADVDEERDADEQEVQREDADDAHDEREQLPDLGGNLGCAGERPLPGEQRAEDAAAVHREAGEEVERGEREVHEREVAEDEPREVQRGRERLEGDVAAGGERDADGGAGERDVELLVPLLGLVAEAGDAAENPERDGVDGEAVPHGDDGVSEFVEDDAGEEPDGGDGAEQPAAAAGDQGVGVQGGVDGRAVQRGNPHVDLRPDEVGEHRQDEQERDVEFDGNPEGAPDAEAAHAGSYQSIRVKSGGGDEVGAVPRPPPAIGAASPGGVQDGFGVRSRELECRRGVRGERVGDRGFGDGGEVRGLGAVDVPEAAREAEHVPDGFDLADDRGRRVVGIGDAERVREQGSGPSTASKRYARTCGARTAWATPWWSVPVRVRPWPKA
jgi:hypothetical protein